MVGEGLVARSAEARVSTGNPSLDAMLEGGLVPHRPYLIVGPSGTGKTTLAIQFLCEGVRRHERVLLVTLEEPPNEAKVNHRGLEPEINRVEVFDAIPDIMRYERAPFKDIASVRTAVPFAQVPFRIRRSPELASVEVTITALEQMLRTEVIRRGYTRVVIDSLTALQYFCMKGFDPISGAQSFLRFLSDLRVTTLLTVEAPLEDIETPERMLARGEIRLFRWELEGQTVRAIGVEKFRGSSHDVRLHPYRIGPQGIDINLDVTISRDTRQIIEPLVPRRPLPVTAVSIGATVSSVTPLVDEVRDLILLGADVAPARSEIESALAATNEGHLDEAQAHLSRVSSLVMGLVDLLSTEHAAGRPEDPTAVAAFQRVLARVDSVRTGVPPTSLPPPSVLQVQLGALLSLLPTPAPATSAAPVPPPPSVLLSPLPAAVGPTPPSVTVEPTPPPLTVEPPPPVSAEPPPPPVGVESPRPPSLVESAPSPAVAEPEVPPPPRPGVVVPAPLPSPPPAPPAVGTASPIPKPGPAPRSRAGRGLPAPPKPRSPTAGPRPSRSTSAPMARSGVTKAEPPPLPTTPVPAWLSAPILPPTPAIDSHAPGPAAPAAPAAPPAPPARASGVPAKRRRKATAAAPSKRAAAHARTPVSHELLAPATSPPALVAVDAKAPPHPVAVVRPEEAPPVPKPRRRPARKRKAPPVVSVSVEPIPPGVFGLAHDESKPSEDPDGRASSEE